MTRLEIKAQTKKKSSIQKINAPKKFSENLEFEARNEVYLVGRVSSAPSEKVLPSGDKVVEFRIVVGRDNPRGSKREVDTLDIATWSAKTRKSASTLRIDMWVEIDGSVRRRFWQAPHGLASRWQVEASEVRRL